MKVWRFYLAQIESNNWQLLKSNGEENQFFPVVMLSCRRCSAVLIRTSSGFGNMRQVGATESNFIKWPEFKKTWFCVIVMKNMRKGKKLNLEKPQTRTVILWNRSCSQLLSSFLWWGFQRELGFPYFVCINIQRKIVFGVISFPSFQFVLN